MESAFEIIRIIKESESAFQRRFSTSLIILLFFDNENFELLSVDQKEIIKRIVYDYTSVMSIDVYQSAQYSNEFLGIEPFSPEYFETYTNYILFAEAKKETQTYRSALTTYRSATTYGVIGEWDLIGCIQFIYVYSKMMFEDPLEAYSIKGFLECSPYGNESFLRHGNELLDAIIQECGKTNYKLSPEHKDLAEKTQIGTKLDVISNQLGSMRDALDIILSKVDNVSEFGNRLEEVISNAFKAEVDRLESAIIDSGRASRLKIIENFVSGQVGVYWDKASDSTRKAILTAAYYLETMPDDEFFDARGITLCASVALEQELDAVFHRAWYSYLENNYSADPSQLVYWPSIWCEYDSNRKPVGHRPFEETEFTLGTMPYLFGWSKRDGKYCPIKNKYRGFSIPIEDFLMSQFDVDKPFDWFTVEGGVLEKIDYVRVKFRNPTAHGDPITAENARNCMKYILGISSDSDSINTDAFLWRILDVKK